MGKISQILHLIKEGLVTNIPPEYQACESCRELTCTSERAATCAERICGERQERAHREKESTSK
jgi:hypothetical protein